MSTALYVDFDNVFSGLLELHLTAALRFAEEPETWLEKLTNTYTVDGPRRWSVLRCYINSSGSAKHPTAERPRIPFASFRSAFVRSGFEVIDCPALTPQMKNAADIKMAIDIVEALHPVARYDEFVIASADSDFTPLLMKIREAPRRTTLISTCEPVDALKAVPDRLVNAAQMIDLLAANDAGKGPDNVVRLSLDTTASSPGVAAIEHEAAFRKLAKAQFLAFTEPVRVADWGRQLRNDLPFTVGKDWFGFGSFTSAIESLHLDNLHRADGYVWRCPHTKRSATKEQVKKGSAKKTAAAKKVAAAKKTAAKKPATKKTTTG